MKKLTKTYDQEVQSYMFIRKINLLWIVNLVLFAGVVFLGIEQAGKGAEISKLEKQLELTSIQKRDLAEDIFESGTQMSFDQVASDSGFMKPTAVLYFDSIETVALAQ